jgi:hypothetical protein
MSFIGVAIRTIKLFSVRISRSLLKNAAPIRPLQDPKHKKPGAVSRPGTRPQFLFPDTRPDMIRQDLSITASGVTSAAWSKFQARTARGTASACVRARPPEAEIWLGQKVITDRMIQD